MYLYYHVHLYLTALVFFVKVLPYDLLMVELDITNVRELEDFLINECMYAVSVLEYKVEVISLLFSFE